MGENNLITPKKLANILQLINTKFEHNYPFFVFVIKNK